MFFSPDTKVVVAFERPKKKEGRRQREGEKEGRKEGRNEEKEGRKAPVDPTSTAMGGR